ncbi:MAG: hypothetical protein HC802_08270 [Caldilineaceae bacterium]|nr:hypothetical protein [Caldilineaceae bacterium]
MGRDHSLSRGKLDLPTADLKLVDQAPTNYEFDLSKGRRLFGYAPQFDMKRMIDDALAMRAGAEVGVIPN